MSDLRKKWTTIQSAKHHIKRLQERNIELQDALVEERLLRRRAYRYYQDRLNSKLLMFMDIVLFASKR